MNAKLGTEPCDEQRLEIFLSGEMSDVEERQFTLHLNDCEGCRTALAGHAAEPEIWREAAELLRADQLDGDDPASMGRDQQSVHIQNVLKSLGPTDDPEMLGRLGGYEISGIVGSGGMGVVLKAIDPSLDRTVAIKVMTPHLAASGAARKRFAREAKAAAAVLHPNVIAIHSVSKDEPLPYLVMPYVRGISLQKRLDREGPLPLQEILRIAAQIAAGLAAAHAQGLVHRDIKPANILLEEGVERVTITDFGLARAVDDATITHSGMIAGTPQYMSPEQARGEAVDPRSDLFSLGSVMYAICTGRPPFRAETSYGVMRRISDDESTAIGSINPDIPPWLCQIISRLMSKRAADRYESAAEVAELLEACLAHVQQPTVAKLPPSLAPRAQASRYFIPARHWTGVIAMIAAIGLGLFGIIAWQATEAPDIAGKWSGPEWGEVVLAAKQPGEYEGTYTDTFQEKPGTIELRWSRWERRYKGTWREGQERSGKISLRLVDGEIRGAWTTSKKSEINPGTPELADLTWKRHRENERPDSSLTQGDKTDKELLQGTWLLVESQKQGQKSPPEVWPHQMVITGNKLVQRYIRDGELSGGESETARFDLEPTKNPKQMNIEWIHEEWQAIYKLEGETLTICWEAVNKFGSDGKDSVRPADFRTTVDSERLLCVYKRAKPHQPRSTVQIKIGSPHNMEVVVADQRGDFDQLNTHKIPARLILNPGKSYRLKLSNIAGREGAEFFPTAAIFDVTSQTEAFLAHNAIPVEFTEEDFDQALAGNFVTKVIYLPDPEFQELALVGVETLVSSRLEPGKDPIAEADRRGSILAVIRLGNKDGALAGGRDRNDFNPGTLGLAVPAGNHSRTPQVDAEAGIRVRVLLSPETHTREMLTKNIGFDQLSIMGSGIQGTIDGKTHTNLVAVLAHRCRLESFEEVEGDAKKFWSATLLVPQNAASDRSNLSLSQQRLDDMFQKGVQFWLDHHRDQLLASNEPRVEPTTGLNWTAGEAESQSLAAAAKRFNAATAQARKELFTPPIPDLTVERLKSGILQSAELYRQQGKHHMADTLQAIVDSGRFPADASELIATGVHARDDAGRTVSRQIVPGFTIPSVENADRRELIVLRPLELIYRQEGPNSADYGDPLVLSADAAGGTDRPVAKSGPMQLSEPREIVLSMDSMKFMLDLDTGDTMDPPAAIRPEQAKMDIRPNQVQPYHYPTALVGLGLFGMEVKENDWHAAAVDINRALVGKGVEPLKEMDQGPERHPTYFFKTKEGTCGVLQLLEIVDKPKGMRLRYKTIVSRPSAEQRGRVLTPKQVVDMGQKLNHSRERIVVRMKVAANRPVTVVDEKGSQHQHWRLFDAETPDFSILITNEGQKALLKSKAASFPNLFVGEWMEFEGTVSAVGLDLVTNPDTTWTYHVELNSLDQLNVLQSEPTDAASPVQD